MSTWEFLLKWGCSSQANYFVDQNWSTIPNVAVITSLCRFFILQIHNLAIPLMRTSHRSGNQTLLNKPVNCDLLVTQNISEKILLKVIWLARFLPQLRYHNLTGDGEWVWVARDKIYMMKVEKLQLEVEKAPQSWQTQTKWQHLPPCLNQAGQSHLVSHSLFQCIHYFCFCCKTHNLTKLECICSSILTALIATNTTKLYQNILVKLGTAIHHKSCIRYLWTQLF